jgi:hypothetical protein
MRGEDYTGLIGGGLDEDRISGYINPKQAAAGMALWLTGE